VIEQKPDMAELLRKTWAVRGEISDVLAFVANFLTVLLALITLWALWTKRTEMSAVFSALVNFDTRWRTHRLKETLGQLAQKDYGKKEDKASVMALMGTLCGQLHPLCDAYPDIKPKYEFVAEIVEKRSRFTEPQKMRLVHELHGILDSLSLPKDGD
jgi:hypothetical protein